MIAHKTDQLTAVERTALICLEALVAESRHRHPLVRDPMAVEILNQIDFEFDRSAGDTPSGAACIVRIKIFDDWARKFLEKHPRAAVVNIGAGLDTRFARIDDGRARWFHLDLPGAIDMRRRLIPSGPRQTCIPGSVLEGDWMDQVKSTAGSRPMLFIAEGILAFFPESEVRSLLAMLAGNFPGSTLIFDAVSAVLVYLQRFHDALSRTGAGWRWGIDDVRRTATWPDGFRVDPSVDARDMRRTTEMRDCFRRLHWIQRVLSYVEPLQGLNTLNQMTLPPIRPAKLTPKKGWPGRNA